MSKGYTVNVKNAEGETAPKAFDKAANLYIGYGYENTGQVFTPVPNPLTRTRARTLALTLALALTLTLTLTRTRSSPPCRRPPSWARRPTWRSRAT